ncbi:MAG TPA: hypothetical protein VJN39_06755 [Gemmatimonadales bacterium]|nr:hypothetical protein [Gemmatimonadales bacterium]
MAKRVYLGTRDLLFRSKLEAVVRAARADVSRDEAASDLVILELGGPEIVERIAALVGGGVPVLAYGSHARPELLTAARSAGATAVPNSQVEAKLRGLLNA